MWDTIQKFLSNYLSGIIKGIFITACILLAIKIIVTVSLSNPTGSKPITESVYYKTFQNINNVVSPIWNAIGTFDIVILIISLIALIFKKGIINIINNNITKK